MYYLHPDTLSDVTRQIQARLTAEAADARLLRAGRTRTGGRRPRWTHAWWPAPRRAAPRPPALRRGSQAHPAC